MSIEVISAGSSSSGNSYIIKAGGHVLILDVGLTAKRIFAALDTFGVRPEDVEAVLVTHEHTDHVKSVRAVSRKCCNAMFYASSGTIARTENFKFVPEERIRTAEAGDHFPVFNEACGKPDSGAEISIFRLSHDAEEPLGFAVKADGEKLAVVTDTGIITDEIYDEIRDADVLVLESNHDEDLLMFGEYPYYLKRRIKGDYGHLSNRTAGETLVRILKDRPDNKRRLRVMLAHLSAHNNVPFVARQTVEGVLEECGFRSEIDYTLDIASREEITVI